ncbi:ATP-NAD-dependent kinase, putative [Babesia bigemina]|uniref:ATP-NAD-dependent kinase, putative n=1 Tax=Babesia bigemina TaxID=5866 RepID=A0A061D658_BABBI|nr:ATP-NAD-dependent kinase, putative [Babesia bigemina]CDR96043.1 ATP-NAD-dependent kinase, putative [Babesia bigemina]|eukprot:XP_012768229.1 ATP-NAD-dependent kinase, putative [Babesia bigemina]
MEPSGCVEHPLTLDPADVAKRLSVVGDAWSNSEVHDLVVVYSRVPKKVMICSSKTDESIRKAREELVALIKEKFDCVVMVHDRLLPSVKAGTDQLWGEVHRPHPGPAASKNQDDSTIVEYKELEIDDVELIIAIGGDGTILKVIKMFPHVIPPVIGLSMGSMGYMAKFNMAEVKETLMSICDVGITVSRRSLLHVEVYSDTGELIARRNALNECVIDRGLSPCITTLDVYYQGSYFTTVIGDGLLISTPSGSTAYSMAAGGPIVHPAVPSMLFTVICPHSISYRPVILPREAVLDVIVPPDNRGDVRLCVDGNYHCNLKQGSYVRVTSADQAFPLVLPNNTHTGDEWIRSLREHLHWNFRIRQQHIAPRLQLSQTLVEKRFSTIN